LTVIKEEKKWETKRMRNIAGYDITSAELVAIKNLDPDTIRVVVESLEDRIGVSPVASTEACSRGTNACSVRRRPEGIKGIVQ
jgi:low affinity Fe/Cu permease